MAKYETTLTADLDDFLEQVGNHIRGASMSASIEDSADAEVPGARMAVRVFERYSFGGGNRVSMSMSVLAAGDTLHVVVVTSGGSQAVLWKINSFGEESFLTTAVQAIQDYVSQIEP